MLSAYADLLCCAMLSALYAEHTIGTCYAVPWAAAGLGLHAGPTLWTQGGPKETANLEYALDRLGLAFWARI